MNFPNETPQYRAARDRLLQAELELRKQTEKVAALRRKLPPGGGVPEELNVFHRTKGVVRHAWSFELLGVKGEAGQDPRHVDMLWPLWNLLDLAPEGRGKDWYPKLAY
jgi:predicted dithiol-disulfide oxidoreductase (DUF899 family)